MGMMVIKKDNTPDSKQNVKNEPEKQTRHTCCADGSVSEKDALGERVGGEKTIMIMFFSKIFEYSSAVLDFSLQKLEFLRKMSRKFG